MKFDGTFSENYIGFSIAWCSSPSSIAGYKWWVAITIPFYYFQVSGVK